jgi:hypothetical protein
MRIICSLVIISGILIISGCSSLSNLETKKKDLTTKRSYIVADAFIDSCGTYNRILLSINLGLLKSDLPDNPDLQQLRTRIDSSIVNIRNFLMSIERYKNLMEHADKIGAGNREFARAQRFILDSLSRASDEYSKMRKTSLSLIRENNLKIITLIVEDYKKKEEEIPLNWIPRNILAELIQIPEIIKIDKKIEEINSLILKKYGNKNGAISLNLLECYDYI